MGGTAMRAPSIGLRRGVSLVEVLVVLVILVIGIFAIARIFPEGFASLRFTGGLSQAQALMKLNEEYLSAHRENLPDGIVAIDRATGLIRLDITPGDLNANFPYVDNAIPGATTPVYDARYSGSNQVRRVIGESLLLSPPKVHPVSGETASFYQVLFGPIYSPTLMPGSSLGVSAYSGTQLRRVVFQNPPTAENWAALAALGVNGYGVDHEAGLVYFLGAPYDREFRIEFTFRANPDSAIQGVPDNVLFVPAAAVGAQIVHDLHAAAGPGGTTLGPQVLPMGTVVEPGSDVLYRRYLQIPTAQAFSSDPYEFKVYDPVFGLLAFNPIAATVSLSVLEGRGLTARVDYDVDDWHILRQDVQAPLEFADATQPAGARLHPIKLSTGAIKHIGDSEDTLNFIEGGTAADNTYEYQGLIRYYPASGSAPARPGSPGVDVVLVDLSTGLRIDSRSLTRVGLAPPIPGATDVNGYINYASGMILLREQVTMTDAFGTTFGPVTVAGRTFRVFYRDANDFAVATRKPFLRYYEQLSLPNTDHRQYYPGYGAGYLIFRAGEAEKTVTVDYTYLFQPPGAPEPELRTEIGELHQIQPPDPTGVKGPVLGTSGLGVDPVDIRHWWIRLAHSSADPGKGGGDGFADPNVVPNSVRIRGVRGASLHTRVSFRDGTRLRHRERSTVLTRELSR